MQLPTQIKSRIMLLIIGLVIFVIACDTLEPDTLLVGDKVSINDQPVVVNTKSSGIIDLSSLINASGAYRFTTSQPRYGKLESLGGSLLKYTAPDSLDVNRDGFKLTVFNEGNLVVDEDSVIIIMPSDSTDVPCGVWALTDYVQNVDSMVIIDVLANDSACGVDRSLLQVAFATDLGTSEAIPLHGTLELLGNGKIRYTPEPSYKGEDRFIYKLTKPIGIPGPEDPEVVSYGFVYISGISQDTAANCQGFKISNDLYELSIDSLDWSYQFYLPVTHNDVFCEDDLRNVNLILLDSTNVGHVEYAPNKSFYYSFPDSGVERGFVEEFSYRLCANGMCGEAVVTIKAK